MGLLMLLVFECGVKISYFSLFGLIKVGFIFRLCFCFFIILFIFINLLLVVNMIYNLVCIVILFINYFVGCRIK